MDIKSIIDFLWQNTMFSFTIIFTNFVLGWFLYSKIITNKISLQDSLFEKDNFAAWLEFIGAFIVPTLFLASKAVAGSQNSNIFMDLLISLIYVICYNLLFMFLRLISNYFVRLFKTDDPSNEKICLNNEIYKQKNIAASLFSISLSIIFANIISFVQFTDFNIIFSSEMLLNSIYKVLIILIATLISILCYVLVLKKKTSLYHELFIDDNPAAGLCFASFIFSIQTILHGIIKLTPTINILDSSINILCSLLLFGVLGLIIRKIFMSLVKVKLDIEIYDQNNLGAALGQGALYFGLANVIVHYFL